MESSKLIRASISQVKIRLLLNPWLTFQLLHEKQLVDFHNKSWLFLR